jgi:hypothetical protein
MDCFASLAMTKRKRPGLLPAFCVLLVMPGLVPGIHVLLSDKKVVDGRVKPSHDDIERPQFEARLGGVAGHDLISAS